MAKKQNIISPGDYYRAGPLEIARFGSYVVGQTNWDTEHFDRVQKAMAERYPEITVKIDGLVANIAEQICMLPPDQVLHIAYCQMATRLMDMASESDCDEEDMLQLRMVDYLQSLIVSMHPCPNRRSCVTDDDWQSLRSSVKELFTLVNRDYHLCNTAARRQADPQLDMEAEAFYFQAQMTWCNVRGHRYLVHEREYLEDLMLSHSSVLERLFGITAEQLIDELMKIQESLTRGMGAAVLELKEFQHMTMDALEARLHETGEDWPEDPQILMAEVIQDGGWKDWQTDLFGRFLGLDLFNVEKVTSIPQSLLDELTWSPGEETSFFAEGAFRGWPLRQWPIFIRPFIKLDGRYLCFELYSLLDNIYRVLQKIVVRLEPDYREEWNRKQKRVSEQLPFKYLLKLLPGAHTFSSVCYKLPTELKIAKKWCECDGLLVYEDHLFVIEVKAGAFTYTPPASDFPAYVESIRNLVLKPSIQGSRFVEYLNSADSVALFDESHEQIGVLSRSQFRHVTICSVTLDSLTEIAARIQHLNALGINIGDYPVWAVSVDDLRTYADIFEEPLVFLHFVEQRVKAFASKILKAQDELDHLGLYIKHNFYSKFIDDSVKVENTEFGAFGYRKDIDGFFWDKFNDPAILSPLHQNMPARFREIISVLSRSVLQGRAMISSYLLDCSGKIRQMIADGIDQALSTQVVKGRPMPVSIYGKIELTIFCWQEDQIIHDPVFVTDHSIAAMLAVGDSERKILELSYSQQGLLKAVKLDSITAKDIPEADMKRLLVFAENLKKMRVEAAGKTGRNAPCPCGSGKKVKKCCSDLSPWRNAEQ